MRKLLDLIKKDLQKVGRSPKKQFPLKNVVAHLLSPFFLAARTVYHLILKVVEQAEANAACDKTEATRPGEDLFYAAPRSALHLSPRSSFCLRSAFG